MTESRAGVSIAMTNGRMVASAEQATGMACRPPPVEAAESGSRMKKPKKAALMAKMARLMAEKAELLAALDSLTAEKFALNGRLARQKRELATARRRISSMEERISSMEKRFELITLLAAPSPGCSTTDRMVASLELPRPSRRREGGSGVRPATLNVDQGAPERRVG